MLKSIALGVAAAIVAGSPAWACVTLESTRVPISACIDDSYWVGQPAEGAQEFLYFSNDNATGFAFITEVETFARAAFREAILTNAAAAADGGEAGVTVADERQETVGGKSWNVIEYALTTGGTALHFQNFYISDPEAGSVQLVFWSAPGDATATAFEAGGMLSTVAFTQ